MAIVVTGTSTGMFVGPDAAPAIALRESRTGEEWVRLGGLDADEWAAKIDAGFGIDVRSCMAE
jgi:hypothetical protein